MIYIEKNSPEEEQYIRGEAWMHSYSHIFTKGEVTDYFNGVTKESRTWSSVLCSRTVSIFCEINGKSVAYAKMCLCKDNQIGELNSLYVLPDHQGKRIGAQLWLLIIKLFEDKKCSGFNIWVMKKARSNSFYIDRGCSVVNTGDYWIGQHCEQAICYHKHLNNG